MSSVSFVCPVFNKAKFLPRVLAAIASQHGNFSREYIFVDDGSSDDSLAVLRRETAGWENVTIIEQSNHGSAHATNRGVEAAKMDFIKFVDADDEIHRDATQILLDAMSAHPDAGLAFGQRIYFHDGDAIDLTTPIHMPYYNRLDYPLRDVIKNCWFNPSQFLVRRDLCQEVGGCDERAIHSQ